MSRWPSTYRDVLGSFDPARGSLLDSVRPSRLRVPTWHALGHRWLGDSQGLPRNCSQRDSPDPDETLDRFVEAVTAAALDRGYLHLLAAAFLALSGS